MQVYHLKIGVLKTRIIMKLFDWLSSTLSSIRNGINNASHPAHSFHDDNLNRINPASGLPMNGSVDIHGNTFGTGSSISHDPFADQNRHHNHFNDHARSFNDYHHHYNDSFHNASLHHDYNDPFRNY